MNLLIYQWNSYFQYDIYEICQEKNISFNSFEWKFENKNYDDEFKSWFYKSVNIKKYDALFSVNYYPVLAQVCKEKRIKYIAWCYDNPLNVENIQETLEYETNYVFVFDRVQYARYRTNGFQTVFYQPLGINSRRLKNLSITLEDKKKYGSEVSFVGNLYDSAVKELIEPLDDYTRGYLKAAMDLQIQIYGKYLFDELITEELINKINTQYIKRNPKTKLQVNKEALTFAMASEVTRQERILLLNLFGKRWKTKFYSYDRCESVRNAIECGSLDYIQQMPKVFACSKINLNPSLKIIQTGIPLRALDIMACGGFLLSNYQIELNEFYQDGKQMVQYESVEDAVDKAKYYLEHDDLRQKIASMGQIETLENHNMENCLENIFKTAGIDG